MKFILAALLLLLASISRLVVIHNGKIGQKEVVVSIPIHECYHHVTNLHTYPRWIPSVLSIENLTKSFHLAIGEEFVIVVDYGFLGTMSYVAQILSVEPNTSFSFILDDWLETRFDFAFTSIDQEKSRMKLTISSNKNNMFYKHIILPIAHLYYTNWLTQCLLRFQLAYS
ncbi:unnamed protein product [Schistosoma margrebowiei]|uniref:Coenzyme Q-binding protein COQ10 START domain-containing protein n=1 Tax=Schistosoma margrebowiei TaxID=48269 RepID=A0AA85AK76_9TREM|nr:unnamed protein product [Schistosoma margrebowiei]